ncbi:MAG: tetratricopeptide repeat protein [Chloroflexi bacterium]|nr:tetratricopeptide repeat protein [Chloroflexota bacterium]
MNDQSPSFAEQLRGYRLRAGLTQEGLAEKAGLATGGVAALERGVRRAPYASTLGALSDALGLSGEERTRFAWAARRRGVKGPHTPPSRPSGPIPPSQPRLRPPLTALVGREAELEGARALLDPTASSVRLLTVVGAGGVGKTVLGLRVATELQDDFEAAWLVELAPLTEPALVPEALATALGIPENHSTSRLEAVARFLLYRSVLLVLDNCEHVLEACVQVADHLLAACPGLRLLATSREALQLPVERVMRLAALAVPEPDAALSVEKLIEYPSVQLFLARVHAFNPDFQLDDETASAVARVCARLEGIPLALELAAARLQVLSLAQLVTRLDRAVSVLGGGRRALPARQQTLRATLDWSYRLLTDAEQSVFRQLAVFAGGCELEAAETVCRGERVHSDDVLEVIAQLVNKSLVSVTHDGPRARYRLLEPVRQYAEDQLAGSDDEHVAREQHVTWFLALAERARPELAGRDQVDWLKRLDRDYDNLRAGLRWLREQEDSERQLRLAVALAPYWEARAHLSEGRRTLEAALALPTAGSTHLARRRDATQAAGQLAQWQAEFDAAQALFKQSLSLSNELGDAAGAAEATAWLGTVEWRRGRYDQAAVLLEESLAAQRALGNVRGTALALLSLGVTVAYVRDLSRARSSLEESLALYRQLEDLRYVAMAQTMLGTVLTVSGDLAQGSLVLAEGLVGHRTIGNLTFLHHGLAVLAIAAVAQGRAAHAARLAGASDALRESIGDTLVPLNRDLWEKLMRDIGEQLPEEDLEAAFAAGYALNADEALDEALADLMPMKGSATPGTDTRQGA